MTNDPYYDDEPEPEEPDDGDRKLDLLREDGYTYQQITSGAWRWQQPEG